MGGSKADDWWSGVCQEQRILDLLVEFHKRREELRNDRSENLSLVELGGRERHDLKNEFCQEV